ncbi:MAG: hypothetical protein CFE41_07725 [Burkholderiales bacterium PBB2]|jgi:hypothetical protein|nr:MAG: hypothetical protein CFE41_07725 [Burkholderiales bacterium PBB2]
MNLLLISRIDAAAKASIVADAQAAPGGIEKCAPRAAVVHAAHLRGAGLAPGRPCKPRFGVQFDKF